MKRIFPSGNRVGLWPELPNTPAAGDDGKTLIWDDENQTFIFATAGGAPTTATYVVVGLDATLTNERRLQGTTNRLTLTDGGAGGDLVLDVGSSVYVAGGTDVAVADGGTGLSSYTAGDMIYASAGTTLSKLAKGTTGDQLRQGASSAPTWAGPTGFWGDGSDGVVDLDGTNTYSFLTKSGNEYTQTRDMQALTLRVRAGCTLKPAGFQPYVQDTWYDDAGVVDMSGGNASGVTGGTGWTNVGSLYVAGAAGANGRTTDIVGLAGTNQSNATGGSGGQGGASGLGRAGGSGGVANAPAADRGAWKQNIGWSLNNCRFITGISLNQPVGGAPGGSGGCSPNGATASSGAGGGPGGLIQVWARYMLFTGTFQARGGNGGNAANTGAGQAGGGGGGGGGHVRVHSTSPTASYTVDVSGGNGGNGANGGSTGSSGSSGTSIHIVV